MVEKGSILRLVEVSKSYEAPSGSGLLTVLNGVSLEAAPGDSLSIVGPSGSGKSTLLHILGTLDRPSSGQIWLDGQELGRLNEAQLAAVRNRRIGFIFQAHYLLPQCTVWENVLAPTMARACSGPGTIQAPETPQARGERLLKRVGLAERLRHTPGRLSGGEQQRAAVVRALINQPQLLLADEPTGSLDRESAQQLAELLVELNREEGVTLVVVTHDRELAARMGRVFELKGGKLAQVR